MGATLPMPAGAASKAPIKIGYLWQIQGESAVGISDYNDGANLAVQQLNAKGGITGHKIVTFRVPLNILTLQATVATFLRAANQNPNAMVGIVAPTASAALASDITKEKIPVLATDVADPFDVKGAKEGSAYQWFAGSYDPTLVSSGINYMVKTLHLSKIAVTGGSDNYGKIGTSAATSALAGNKLKPFTTQSYSETATNLSSVVLATQGADGVFSWGYPNPLAVQQKEMAQSNQLVPFLSNVGAEQTASGGLVPPEQLKNLLITAPCNPGNPTYSTSVAAYAKAYKAKYGTAPRINSAWAYDGVMAIAKAVKASGGKITSAAIQKGLAKVSFSGACGVLKADAKNVLNHQGVIIRYTATGTPKNAKVFLTHPKY
ncbi:MAG TPA: ABC transporter substrate-binding protein [Acidimicrobiales bacterium]|nr:ABC transporter substrate-binding protein [Acidimicrobiales bacterium]